LTLEIAMYIGGAILVPTIVWAITVTWQLRMLALSHTKTQDCLATLIQVSEKGHQREVVPTKEWQEIVIKIRRLDELHAKTDEDGVPVWYVRRSLEGAINKLSENIDKQTAVFAELIREIRAERQREWPSNG